MLTSALHDGHSKQQRQHGGSITPQCYMAAVLVRAACGGARQIEGPCHWTCSQASFLPCPIVGILPKSEVALPPRPRPCPQDGQVGGRLPPGVGIVMGL